MKWGGKQKSSPIKKKGDKKKKSMQNNLDLAYRAPRTTGEFKVELLRVIAGGRSSTSAAQSWQGSCPRRRLPWTEKRGTKRSKCAVRGWKGSA